MGENGTATMAAPSILYPSLSGQIVVITGASSGIGLCLARLLASQGSLLSLADLNGDQLAIISKELLALYPQPPAADQPSPVFTHTLDVRSAEACEAWVAETQKHFSMQRVRGAALMAGVTGQSVMRESGLLRTVSAEEFDFVLDVNVRGVAHCLKALLPVMVEGSHGRGGGSIALAGSAVGFVGSNMAGPYSVSKHAVHGLMRTAAKEEGYRAIRVNAVAPGIIETPMIKVLKGEEGRINFFKGGDPGALGRKGDPEEVAQVLAFLLSDQSSFVNGAVLAVDGGWLC